MAKSQEVAKTQGGLPAALMERMKQDAGKGTSTSQEDNLVPLIYVLQALSPQVNKRGSEHIEGAEAGDIWLRNAPNPIVKGEEGVLFQPCHFHKEWVEWVPRDSGGGFVGRHESCPSEAERQVDEKNPNKVKFVMPNGNEVIETRYHAGFVILEDGTALPYIIPFTSSGHSVSREWMFKMNSYTFPDGSGIMPSWSRTWRLKTKERTNAAGTWFTLSVENGDWVDEAAYDRGSRLYQAFESGAKRAENPDVVHGDEGEDAKAF